jgi:protein gp37
MAQATSIEWTDATWNPVTGCDRVSPGCANCYALELAPRLRRFAQARGKGKWLDVRDGGKASGPAFGVTLHPDALDQPLRWRKPRRVFVNSMSDLFHEEIPDEYIVAVFNTMRASQQHTFQVLTKRPERMRDFCMRLRFHGSGAGRMWLADEVGKLDGYAPMGGLAGCSPMPNVWLGVSIENRRYVSRADLLRETPAAVRFISAEPLLGPLVRTPPCGDPYHRHNGPCSLYDWSLDLTGIDWLIVGGESGSEHRPMKPEWVRDLRDAILFHRSYWQQGPSEYHPAFFFKQWGGRTPKSGGRMLDGRTWDEMPTVRSAA